MRFAAAATIMFPLALAGGCGTSRVDETVTTTDLARRHKAVVLMKIGGADSTCTNASVLLGQRDGAVYKAVKKVDVVGLRVPKEPAVSEVELDEGEYHVVGYSCTNENGKQFAFSSNVEYEFRSSLASFSVARGEIVNVGWLRLEDERLRKHLLSRTLPMTISVTDWPLDELRRFEARRPLLFAAMATRLMEVRDGPTPEQQARECADLAGLRAKGKVEALPARCAVKGARKGAG